MNDFILMTDSTADMPEPFYRENQIPVLSLTYTLENRTYTQSDSLPIPQFYDKLRKGALPVTSQINPEAALNGFRAAAQQDRDILCICFSSALSGTSNSYLVPFWGFRRKRRNGGHYKKGGACASPMY